MNGHGLARFAIAAALVLFLGSTPVLAQEAWSTGDGTVTLTLAQEFLDQYGLSIETAADSFISENGALAYELEMSRSSDLGFVVDGIEVTELSGLHVRVSEGLQIWSVGEPYTVTDFAVITEDAAAPARTGKRPGKSASGPGYFELAGLKTVFDPVNATFALASRDVRISQALARAIGEPDLAGQTIGWAEINAGAYWAGGDAPLPIADHELQGNVGQMGGRTVGGDMIFCQLYGLGQYGRLGDIVGLSVAGTSWNVGDDVIPWYSTPSENHPFIVWDMFRLKVVDGSERFEQIGQSHIKHGFCALDSSQCSTQCQATGCSTLGIGCTDTYSASLNASQGGLGPRYEVDPWWRQWEYTGSHNSLPYHSHNPITHRCQVYDDDLDPALNPGASYFCSSFYVCPEDINNYNSAAWKPTTVSGYPGGNWSFGMSGAYTLPEYYQPIDAWDGALQTVLAEEVPVIDFVSPDGRCVLGAKATDLGDGWWHYEYAVLNVDMDRQAGSFSIPVRWTEVANIGFHAVHHHDEPYNTWDADAVPIDNDPWTVEVTEEAITWSTTSNPIRWETMYNFRFDADAPPIETTVTLGLFRPGTPSEVTGLTIGPELGPPDCNDNGIPDDEDIAEGTSQDVNGNGVPDECEYEGQLILADDFTVVRGVLLGGDVLDLHADDDSRLEIQAGLVLSSYEPPVWVEMAGTAPTASPGTLRFYLEAGVRMPGMITQKVELFNYDTQGFEVVDTRMTTTDDSVVEVLISSNPSRFIDSETLEMTARATWITTGVIAGFPWNAGIDVGLWTFTE